MVISARVFRGLRSGGVGYRMSGVAPFQCDVKCTVVDNCSRSRRQRSVLCCDSLPVSSNDAVAFPLRAVAGGLLGSWRVWRQPMQTADFGVAHLDLFEVHRPLLEEDASQSAKRPLRYLNNAAGEQWLLSALPLLPASWPARVSCPLVVQISSNPANSSSFPAGAGLFPTIAHRTFMTSSPFHASADSSVRDTLASATPSAQGPVQKRGSLTSGSIFDDEFDAPVYTTGGAKPRRKRPASDQTKEIVSPPLEERDIEIMGRTLDPNPKIRLRWQRKMVIQDIQRRGRLTKTEQIARTERENLSKSHWFKTSVKKLGMLARQVAGKNIDDAILQMRFSKKKAAKDLKAFLEQARNEAVVTRGMGVSSKAEGEEKVEPMMITLKDKKRWTVNDPSAIYISQAWVNRGPYGRELDHRARGNVNIMRPPHTGVSVVLKEEKTRVREWQEREAKEIRQRRAKVWTALPDRKIISQNQYYSW